jgi:hypothetical protein
VLGGAGEYSEAVVRGLFCGFGGGGFAGPRKVLIAVRSAQEWEHRCEKHAADDDSSSGAA